MNRTRIEWDNDEPGGIRIELGEQRGDEPPIVTTERLRELALAAAREFPGVWMIVDPGGVPNVRPCRSVKVHRAGDDRRYILYSVCDPEDEPRIAAKLRRLARIVLGLPAEPNDPRG